MHVKSIEITENQSLTEQCQLLFSNKCYQQLKNILQKAIIAEPHKADIWVWLAMLALENKQYAQAYRATEQALQFNRQSSAIYALMGKILFAQASAMAEQAWRRAVYLNPENNQYRDLLARSLRINQKTEYFIEKVVKTKSIKASYHNHPFKSNNKPNKKTEPIHDTSITPSTHTLKNPCVIIPVYDDFDSLKHCLTSVIVNQTHCKIQYDIVVINDASPSPEICHYLQALLDKNKIILLNNENNLGFIKTINKALDYTQKNDVVLLNSDTQVFQDWFDRLYHTAYANKKIASVTPFSNNAQLVSFPKIITDNTLTDPKEALLIDQACAIANKQQFIEIPTGIGFCLFLKRDVLNKVGKLDDQALIRGYGEDIDLCLRIKKAGYLNVCATDVFVAHYGNKSFKNEKRLRVFQNQKILNQRYPNNEQIYSLFIRHDPLYLYRQAAEIALIDHNKFSYQLIIAPKDGFLNGNMQELRFQCGQSDNHYLWLFYDGVFSNAKGGKYLSLAEDKPIGYHNLHYHSPNGYNELNKHLQRLTIDNIIIYNTAIIDNDLAKLLKPYPQQFIDLNQANQPSKDIKLFIQLNKTYPTLSPHLQTINIAIIGKLDDPQQHQWLLNLARFIRYKDLAINFWVLTHSLNPNELINTGIVTFASNYAAGLGEWHQRFTAANIHILMSINEHEYDPFLLEIAISAPQVAISVDQAFPYNELGFHKRPANLAPTDIVYHLLSLLNIKNHNINESSLLENN